MEENTEKLTYEQLEQVASQLSNQVRDLSMRLQQCNMNNVFKRLEFLFKVLENDVTLPTSFVAKCAQEIENLLTLPEETEESKEEEVEE